MKVQVDKIGKRYRVLLSQGVQSFSLNYSSTKKDCLWMAKMFRNALKNHDKEKQAKKK